jgi:hypothetical protein
MGLIFKTGTSSSNPSLNSHFYLHVELELEVLDKKRKEPPNTSLKLEPAAVLG